MLEIETSTASYYINDKMKEDKWILLKRLRKNALSTTMLKYTLLSFWNKNKNVVEKKRKEKQTKELTLNGQILIISGEIFVFCTDQNTKLYKTISEIYCTLMPFQKYPLTVIYTTAFKMWL